MELLFEILLDFIMEGVVEVSKSNKVNKFLRYFAIALIVLFFSSVILLMLFIGISVMKESSMAGTIIIGIGLLMFGCSLYKFKEVYLSKKSR